MQWGHILLADDSAQKLECQQQLEPPVPAH